MLSANLTAAAAYRDYVQDFSDELITRAFYSPKTVDMSTVHEGVKGRLTLTRLKALAGAARAWSKDFQPVDNAVAFEPRHLDVFAIKRDLSFVPQEFEQTYLGYVRKQGQNPGSDLPFEGYILQHILSTHAEELDAALWQGVRAGTVTGGTTAMSATFHGILKLITDAVTATTLAPVVTSGGAITQANVIGLIETMWDGLGAAYKENAVNIFCSWDTFQKYQKAYRDAFGKYVSDNKDATVTLDFSKNAVLVPMPGMGASNRIVMTPAANLHVGFDSMSDQMFNFEMNKRVVDFWMDFKVGVQIAQLDEGAVVVNDLA
jgi:hypothetical protein